MSILDGTTQSGIIFGFEVTVNVDPGKIDIAEGRGVIFDWSPSSGVPIKTFITFPAQTAVTITNLATATFTTLMIDATGALIQAGGVPLTPQQRRENIRIQSVAHTDFLTITDINSDSQPAYDVGAAMYDYVTALGAVNDGNKFIAASTNLTVAKESGTTSLPYINRANDSQNPTNATNASISPVSFTASFQDGVGGFSFEAPTTVLNVGEWDDGSGTLAAVSPISRFQVMRFFFFGQSGNVTFTYGQALYNSLDEAKASIFTEDPAISSLLDAGVFTTAVIVQGNTTDLSDTADAEFVGITLGLISTGAATGDMIGPASSTANAVVRFVNGDGKVTKDGQVLISDTGAVTGLLSLAGNEASDIPITNAGAGDVKVENAVFASGTELAYPTADGSAGQPMVSDGAGVLSIEPDLSNLQTATFRTLQTDSSTSGAVTFDWSSDTKLKITLTENITGITMTAPAGPGNFMLEIVQDSTARTMTGWPATVKWVDGVEPVISIGSGDVDILSFFYDGTNFYGSFLQDFS